MLWYLYISTVGKEYWQHSGETSMNGLRENTERVPHRWSSVHYKYRLSTAQYQDFLYICFVLGDSEWNDAHKHT